MPSTERATCEQFLRQLDRCLDGDLPGPEAAALEEHLEWCVRCAREHRFERALLDGVRRRLRAVRAPPGLRERIASLLAIL
ncbi:MAG TPA: zf-HC2 domain-containing protein [Gemmatimonadales bacterium]|jgi:anti-sigma factor (TIGR02949 family)|nr:zf-HC2 domain-containing protein [Gemmatimonadales bacterium]